MKNYYVYILSNFTRTVLYIGVTDDLIKRVWQHKQNLVRGFTQKYSIHELLYYETYSDPVSAIEREKQLKKYSRTNKEEIIHKFNPNLSDLFESIQK